MIEVTDEMLALLREYQMGAYGEMDDFCDKHIIAALIELHEANKPKPEPLSEVEILKLALRDLYPLQFKDRSYGIALDKVTVVDFARLIEQAHGIT